MKLCAWCKGVLDGRRSDTRTCSKRCRQARARFQHDLRVLDAAAERLTLHVFDPPYKGKAHLYRGHADYQGEVDPVSIVSLLEPLDGWAWCMSADELLEVGALCRAFGLRPRVASWHRGHRPSAISHGPRQAWEAVIYQPARADARPDWTPDALSIVPRARTTDPGRVIGAKPARYIDWLFGLMGARALDTIVDHYPGSGGFTRAWEYVSISCSSDTSRLAGDDTSSEALRDVSHRAQGDTSADVGRDGSAGGVA